MYKTVFGFYTSYLSVGNHQGFNARGFSLNSVYGYKLIKRIDYIHRFI